MKNNRCRAGTFGDDINCIRSWDFFDRNSTKMCHYEVVNERTFVHLRDCTHFWEQDWIVTFTLGIKTVWIPGNDLRKWNWIKCDLFQDQHEENHGILKKTKTPGLWGRRFMQSTRNFIGDERKWTKGLFLSAAKRGALRKSKVRRGEERRGGQFCQDANSDWI